MGYENGNPNCYKLGMKSERLLFMLASLFAVALLLFACGDENQGPERTEGAQRADQSTPPGAEPPVRDAGTGNAAARGTQTGSGTRSDYKPTTGPGGIEETKEQPK